MQNKTILTIVAGICFLIYTALAITTAVYFSKHISKVSNSENEKNSQSRFSKDNLSTQQKISGMTDKMALGFYISMAIVSVIFFVIQYIILKKMAKSDVVKKLNESFANVGTMSIKMTQYGLLIGFISITLMIFLGERDVIPIGPSRIDNTTSEGKLIQTLSIPKFIFGVISGLLIAVSLSL